MRFLWDEEKNQRLIAERGVRFEDVVTCILEDRIIATIKNPNRIGQFYLVLKLNDYIHVVPFIINDNEEMILKTIIPSRKYQKKYGGNEL